MKYFFSDVDGTFMQDHKLNENTNNTVKSFIDAGNKFVLCTGRIDSDIKKIEETIGFYGDYRISQNGSVIKDKNNNVIYKKLLPVAVITKLTEYVYSLKDVTIEITEVDKRYSKAPRHISYQYTFTSEIIIDKDLVSIIPNLECTLFLILSDNEEQFSVISKYIKENFTGIYAVQTSPGCLEIISNEVSKGNAIAYLQDLLRIKSEDIIVAGDSYNDVSMFERFENSFVMETAPEDVKCYANNVVKNVAEAIEVMSAKK